MNEDLKRWDDIAQLWSAKHHFKEFRPLLIFPAIKSLLGNLKGRRILDAGCGDGVYDKLFLEQGASVVALDGSPKMVELAKKANPGIEFLVADLLKPLPYESSSFDTVVSILILMSLAQIQTFLSEAKRILKEDGNLLVVVKHPAFSDPTMKLYKTIWQKLLFRKPNGLAEDYYLKTEGRNWEKGSAIYLPYYHRTLQQYSEEFKKAGFSIEAMAEPNELPKEYLRKHPKLEYVKRLPRFLIFKLVKA